MIKEKDSGDGGASGGKEGGTGWGVSVKWQKTRCFIRGLVSSNHQESLLKSQILGLSGYFCGKQERAWFCVWIDVEYVRTRNLRDLPRNLGLQASLCHVSVGRAFALGEWVFGRGKASRS